MTDLATYVSALAETWEGLESAVTGLSPADWDRPTDLPGWSVKDNVSHVVGVELVLLGEPYPSSHVLPESMPHVRNEVGRYMEVPVDLRRALPGESVLAELRDVTERRLKMLRVLDESNADDEVRGFLGRPTRLRHLLGLRAFDCWAHEQDVRRALGLPRSLSGTAADVSRRRLLLALTGLAEDVPEVAGKTVVIATTGALASAATLTYADPPSYVEGDTEVSDVLVRADFETVMLLGTGRVPYTRGLVSISGDVALGEALVRNFAVTP
jgi:uncharacterized protein (TIGR03083 family)